MKEDKPPEGKNFYGSVTVSERGQVVIPAEAREDYDIDAGDKLLVFGDLKMGLWIATFGIIENNLEEGTDLLKHLGVQKSNEGANSSEESQDEPTGD